MFDTNILVRALISPDGAASRLLKLTQESHVLITSAYQLSELLEVLRRPRLRILHGKDDHDLKRVVVKIYKTATTIPLPPEMNLVVQNDPKDNAIVMTAVLGKADVLCTLDRHFFNVSVVEYCFRHGVRILNDQALLQELRAA